MVSHFISCSIASPSEAFFKREAFHSFWKKVRGLGRCCGMKEVAFERGSSSEFVRPIVSSEA